METINSTGTVELIDEPNNNDEKMMNTLWNDAMEIVDDLDMDVIDIENDIENDK